MILLVALLLVILFMVTDTSYQAAQWLSHGLDDSQNEPPQRPGSTKPENKSSSAPHAMPITATLDPPVVLDSSADRCAQVWWLGGAPLWEEMHFSCIISGCYEHLLGPAQVSGTGKVALMFLTVGEMPHAPTWKLWLASAAGKLPKRNIHCSSNEQEIASSCKGPTAEEAAKLDGSALLQAQHLFSLYVHAPPHANREFSARCVGFSLLPWDALLVFKDSIACSAVSTMDPLFRDNIIATRIETHWGSMTLVHAARLLLWEAYRDPMNGR